MIDLIGKILLTCTILSLIPWFTGIIGTTTSWSSTAYGSKWERIFKTIFNIGWIGFFGFALFSFLWLLLFLIWN